MILVWTKGRTTPGTGGFIRYATATCLNHLKVCPNVPPEIHHWAAMETARTSPKKRYSPYGMLSGATLTPGTFLSGETLIPGTFTSGVGPSQMLPPLSFPPSRLNSPALYLQTTTLPLPANSPLPSPQLSDLLFPLINTLPSPQWGVLGHNPSPALSVSSIEPSTPQVQSFGWGEWSLDTQKLFKVRVARLTVAAGLPLSWVDNPEWIDLIYHFLPAAKSPSRKVLTTRLIPQLADEYRGITKESLRDKNTTIQADGWTGANFHHLLAFMVTTRKKVLYIKSQGTLR